MFATISSIITATIIAIITIIITIIATIEFAMLQKQVLDKMAQFKDSELQPNLAGNVSASLRPAEGQASVATSGATAPAPRVASGVLEWQRHPMQGSKARKPEPQLWRLLKRASAAERLRLLERCFTEHQRQALERWALEQRSSRRPAGPRKQRQRRQMPGKLSVLGTTSRGSRAGVRGVQSHLCKGRLRYNASVACGPFRVFTRMDTHLPTVIRQLEFLVAVRRRAARALGGDCKRDTYWDEGSGEQERQFKAFSAALLAESQASRGLDNLGLRFVAYVPAKFWIGKVLETPRFAATAEGLEQGFRAWQRLFEARGLVHTGHTNRHTSLAIRHSPEKLKEAWTKLRDAYLDVWEATGHERSQVAAHLATLEARFQHSEGLLRRRAPSRSKGNRLVGACNTERRILKLLQCWPCSMRARPPGRRSKNTRGKRCFMSHVTKR
eukprot:TRINITY_DN8533_c0_g1_i2.p1 TRINITY_DN8533_c0_g1~~TRINITY_DN8533_c0_g1_i2.p1  ORF type:complete len:441 (+),score=78.51 TRINITY_DN8533_c0_g1_i2:166-1488(+)